MKRIVCVKLLLILGSLYAEAQNKFNKPLLDSAAYSKWKTVTSPSLSADGRFAIYTIENPHTGTAIEKVVISTEGTWKRSFAISAELAFISKEAAAFLNNDSVHIICLGKDETEVIPHVESYMAADDGTNEWLVYRSSKDSLLTVRNILSKKEQRFNSVLQYEFNPQRTAILLRTAGPGENIILTWINLRNDERQIVWQGKNILNLRFHPTHNSFALLNRTSQGNCIWMYNEGWKTARIIGDETSLGLDSALYIDEIGKISNDGNSIFIYLKASTWKASDPGAVQLDIWTYKDLIPQRLQKTNFPGRKYLGVVKVPDKKIIKLSGEDDGFIPPSTYGDDRWTIVYKRDNVVGGNAKTKAFLVSTSDGSTKKLPYEGYISPSGKYVVGFDTRENGFYCYETSTANTRILTRGISTVWNNREPNQVAYARGMIAAWLENDAGVLVYDLHDIWLLSFQAGKAPVNVTNGFGSRNGIMLFLARTVGDELPVSQNAELILSAFTLHNTNNGFCKIKIGEKKDPQVLTMGRYAYSLTHNPYVPSKANFEPVKAKKAKMYIVQRESAAESPNYFSTRDFKTFTRLSNIYPEKDYNWYTTELLEWKSPDSIMLQGVLYKPENFDPHKKYPVIIYYYTKRSDNLNCYQPAVPSVGVINKAWYASNGYLIFEPDIHYKRGDAYQSCLNSVVSAAKYLSRFPYVNAKKMAINGGSWGGMQTNYLVTHTNIFAAACSSSSIGDFISHYNSYSHGGMSTQEAYEAGDHGPGATLWENVDWYIKNSPVMSADKVTTPLLMFETTRDEACPFVNALEFFIALKRLGKKVWMLEYNEGNHLVFGKDAMDFDIRLQQFFNYYLKDLPPPEWMTMGRPFHLRGIDERLQLDSSTAIP